MEVSWRDYVDLRIEEREKAHAAQIYNAERNLSLAADELREKLKGMNQFRQQIDAERALYIRMDQLKSYHDRIEELERWRANVLGRQLVFGAAVVVGSAALAGIVVAVLRMVGH